VSIVPNTKKAVSESFKYCLVFLLALYVKYCLTGDGSHRDNFGENLENFVSCRFTVAGFLLGPSPMDFFGTHKTPSYITNMLPKVFFDNTVFVKF
jgi:hypothetical protein